MLLALLGDQMLANEEVGMSLQKVQMNLFQKHFDKQLDNSNKIPQKVSMQVKKMRKLLMNIIYLLTALPLQKGIQEGVKRFGFERF